MAQYEYDCKKCRKMYRVFSQYFYDSPEFTADECPSCGIRGVRRMCLPAARTPWNPHVSFRHADHPIYIDSASHDREVRRKLGLVDGEVPHPQVDEYVRTHYNEERNRKGKEMRERQLKPEQVKMPMDWVPPYVREGDNMMTFEERKAKRQRFKKAVKEVIREKEAASI